MSTPIDNRLREALNQHAFRHAMGGIPMTLMAIAAIGWMQWIDHHAFITPRWLMAALLVTCGRGVILIHVQRQFENLSLRHREWLFAIPLAITALIWATLPIAAFPKATDNEQFGMLCIMAGMAGGAASVLAPVNWSARFYLFCLLLPGAGMIELYEIGPVINVLAVCFFIVMVISHANTRQLLIESILTGFQNTDLQNSQTAQQRELKALNKDLMEAQAALREQNANLEAEIAARTERNRLAYAVLQNTGEGIMVTDAKGLIIEVNPGFSQITGFSPDEVLLQPTRILYSERQPAGFYDLMNDCLRTSGSWEGEMWSRRSDGSAFFEHRSIDAVRDENGEVTHYVSIFRDITKDLEKDEQMRHLATHDPLTGLANRMLLHDHLKLAMASADRHGKRVALLFLDLDEFKAVNDTLGHGIGDRLLIAVANRLTPQIRKVDTLARLGGDEFVALLAEIKDPNDCAIIARKFQLALTEPFEIDGLALHVNTSIGIAVYPEDGKNTEVLMKHADMALYAAKGSGKNQFHYYQADLSASAEARRELEDALRRAIANDGLDLHYQPKIGATSGKIDGFEALVRWNRPGIGFIPPDRFIPVAEGAGLIDDVGAFVIRQACRQLAEWHRQGLGWQKMAINVSARQLVHQNLVGIVGEALIGFGLPPNTLELEVTESVVMSQPEKTIPQLTALRAMGIGIAIDDFGTGHSSLAYLRHLPVDILKIDRSFVVEATANPTAHAIIRTIVDLSRALSLTVVAEGVETAEQAEMLRALGCHQLQGYYFSRPMSGDDIAAQHLRPTV